MALGTLNVPNATFGAHPNDTTRLPYPSIEPESPLTTSRTDAVRQGLVRRNQNNPITGSTSGMKR